MTATDELQHLCAEGGSHTRIKYLRSKIKRATIAELRKLLRERGVRFNEFQFMTQWTGALGESVEAYPTDTFPDTLLVKHVCLTPEQAIAATLGTGTCHNIAPTYLDFLCSECGFVHYHSDENDSGDGNEWHYCPNCGARVVDTEACHTDADGLDSGHVRNSSAYEDGYRDGSVHYELDHCPACKNIADLQEALAENAKLRELVKRYHRLATGTDELWSWQSVCAEMQELGIEVDG